MPFHARRPLRGLAVQVALMASWIWCLVALLGEHGVAGLGGGIGAMLGTAWRSRRELGNRDERRAIAQAVHEHRDPGPGHRQAVNALARRLVAHPVLIVWVGTLVLGGLGVVCLVAAAMHDDRPGAVPGVALLLCAAAHAVMQQRAVDRAAQWLADPPRPVPAEVDA